MIRVFPSLINPKKWLARWVLNSKSSSFANYNIHRSLNLFKIDAFQNKRYNQNNWNFTFSSNFNKGFSPKVFNASKWKLMKISNTFSFSFTDNYEPSSGTIYVKTVKCNYISRSNIQRGIANYNDFLKILTSNTLSSNLTWRNKISIYLSHLHGAMVKAEILSLPWHCVVKSKKENMNKTNLSWAQYYGTRLKTLLQTLK